MSYPPDMVPVVEGARLQRSAASMLECICMRTTVEIRDEQRMALAALAAKRGIRGFSALVQEAIDHYLAEMQADDLDAVLALRGTLKDEDADELRRLIAEAWSTWPASS